MRNIQIKVFLLIMVFNLASCGLFDKGVSETFTFFSAAVKNISTVEVYYPDSYSSSTPVIYLLNGWGASADAWNSGIDLEEQAVDRDLMFVSLTAGTHTYTDNPSEENENFETYVLEVVAKVEKNYDLDIDYRKRALCGISNGGGGAIYILSENPDIFKACGVLSGTYYSNMTNYDNLSEREIRIDVGKADGVISEMRFLHGKLDDNDIPHEYYERSGGHNWTFWEKWCPKQFDFLEDVIAG